MRANDTDVELELVRWHIEAGERHVSRQLEIIEDLQERGEASVMATALLCIFEETLESHYERLRQLERRRSA